MAEQKSEAVTARYSPQQTAEIRKAAISDVINAQADMLTKADHKVNMHDLEEVKAVTDEYVKICVGVGIVPNLEGLAGMAGVSRQWIYKFVSQNPDSETAQFLNRVRLMWASARMSLAERGLLDAASTIFVLKNSGLNFADRHEVEIDQAESSRPGWATGMSDDRYRKYLIESLPEPDE